MTFLTQHTLAQNQQVNKWWGLSLAILGDAPSIQILWSMPPDANPGVPALFGCATAAQTVLHALTNKAPIWKCEVVASNSLNIQSHMWGEKKKHIYPHKEQRRTCEYTHTQQTPPPHFIACLRLQREPGAERDLTIVVDGTTLSHSYTTRASV